MSEQLLKACDLYSKTSRGPGNREYWVGVMGGVKILIFRVHDPQADGPSHTLFFTARPPRQDRPTRSAERGQATQERAREVADAWTREQRDDPF